MIDLTFNGENRFCLKKGLSDLERKKVREVLNENYKIIAQHNFDLHLKPLYKLLRPQSKHHPRILNPHIQVPIAALLYITHTTHVD